MKTGNQCDGMGYALITRGPRRNRFTKVVGSCRIFDGRTFLAIKLRISMR
ncbi:MAG: hypothetical protein HYY10_01655 [Candidatus Liptonbacteria bacterium]|nr:hypothetical protein [Candidatus Liptonbacteria bacterium]